MASLREHDLISPKTQKIVDEAVKELHIDHNPTYDNIFNVLDSYASSAIEGVNSRLWTVFYDLNRIGFSNEGSRLVIGNLRANQKSRDIGRSQFTIEREHILEIHRTLFKNTAYKVMAGKPRVSQNWIGDTPSPIGATFVPPPEYLVNTLLDDLCKLFNRTDLNPLVQAAIIHAQFETIHPFFDGNGRIGRALINLALNRREALSAPIPISLKLYQSLNEYYNRINNFHSGKLDEWIVFFIEKMIESRQEYSRYSTFIDKISSEWLDKAQSRFSKHLSNKFISILITSPVLTERVIAASLGDDHNLVNRLLDFAVHNNILCRSKEARVWENTLIIKSMEDLTTAK